MKTKSYHFSVSTTTMVSLAITLTHSLYENIWTYSSSKLITRRPDHLRLRGQVQSSAGLDCTCSYCSPPGLNQYNNPERSLGKRRPTEHLSYSTGIVGVEASTAAWTRILAPDLPGCKRREGTRYAALERELGLQLSTELGQAAWAESEEARGLLILAVWAGYSAV